VGSACCTGGTLRASAAGLAVVGTTEEQRLAFLFVGCAVSAHAYQPTPVCCFKFGSIGIAKRSKSKSDPKCLLSRGAL
jgi:hypothetical protein